MRFWSLNTVRSTFFQRWCSIHTSVVGSRAHSLGSDLPLYLPDYRAHVSISAGFPSGLGFLGNPSTVPYPVDTCSRSLENDTGLLRSSSPFVAECRTPLFAGFLGGVSGSTADSPSPYPCLLAQADNPRRLVPPNDDSDVDSCACPYSALLDGIPGRIPSDRLLSPLCGLMVSRYRRGYAVTSTPEGQELHLHGDEVIKDQLILAPYPPQPL